MSHNGISSKKTTDENRPPTTTTTIPTPVFVPMLPMFFPYANTGTPSQQYYPSGVYPNMQTYASVNTHRQGNFGLAYNPYYTSFYPQSNGIISSTAHANNSATILSLRPLMPPPLTSIQRSSSAIMTTDTERNKNLNIRECKSPELINKKREKVPLQIVHPNEINRNSKNHEDTSSTSSSIISPTESDQNLARSSSTYFIQEIESDNSQDDFLTFIEQKTKVPLSTATSMPELNPFAHEFSFNHNKTLTEDSSPTTNGIDHQHQTSQQDPSSFRLLFDNLIEKSLESIDAIKKSSKKVPTKDASIQYNQISDTLSRSTQTTEIPNNNQLLEEYTSRTMNSIDKLLNDFQKIYHQEYHDQYKSMANTCDELRHLILFIRHIVSSSNVEQSKNDSPDFNNPFSMMIDKFENINNKNNHLNADRTSQMKQDFGRGICRSMKSTNNHSPMPSFSCRQIEPVIVSTTQLCLLCQRPVDNRDDTMHKICRTLITHPKNSTDT